MLCNYSYIQLLEHMWILKLLKINWWVETNQCTHSITHSLTHLPTHSLIHIIAHTLIISLSYSFSQSFTHSLTHSLILSLTHSLIPSHALTQWLTQSLQMGNLLFLNKFNPLTPKPAKTGQYQICCFYTWTGQNSPNYHGLIKYNFGQINIYDSTTISCVSLGN